MITNRKVMNNFFAGRMRGRCFRLLAALTAGVVCLSCMLCTFCSCKDTNADIDRPSMTVNVEADGNTVYNGSEQLFYEVLPGQKAVVRIKVTCTGGSIAFFVHERENESAYAYRGTVTESCEFDVIIEEPSQYRIYITADDFHGSYGVNWQTETAAAE